jgi:hypothetical protein
MLVRQADVQPLISVSTRATGLRHKVRTALAWLSEWVQSCADHYAAAHIYQSLSRLSDAELAARGLARATLARDLIEMHEGARKAAPGREGQP